MFTTKKYVVFSTPKQHVPFRYYCVTRNHACNNERQRCHPSRNRVRSCFRGERTITPSPIFSAENELAAEQPHAHATTTSPWQSNSRRSRPPKHLPIARSNWHHRGRDVRSYDRSTSSNSLPLCATRERQGNTVVQTELRRDRHLKRSQETGMVAAAVPEGEKREDESKTWATHTRAHAHAQTPRPHKPTRMI